MLNNKVKEQASSSENPLIIALVSGLIDILASRPYNRRRKLLKLVQIEEFGALVEVIKIIKNITRDPELFHFIYNLGTFYMVTLVHNS